MSTRTSTTTTRKDSTAKPTDSTVRPSTPAGQSVCGVRFGAWGPQGISVNASTGGGRGGAPYVAVRVGACLHYAYDQAAIDCHARAWESAERMNRSVRLPEFRLASTTGEHREDLSVVCNEYSEQPSRVVGNTGPDGRPLITVTVGAVTIDVHTPTALRSHLTAWRRASTVTGLLADHRNK